MAITIIYVDHNGNHYVNSNNNFYIAKELLHYLKYRPYIYKDGKFKTYTAYIRQSDGSYLKLIPYICT